MSRKPGQEPWHTPDSFKPNAPPTDLEMGINSFDEIADGLAGDQLVGDAYKALPKHRNKREWTIISGGE